MKLLSVALFLATVIASAMSVAPQTPTTRPPVVELTLLVDHSMPATVRVRAGERVTVGSANGRVMALVPAVQESALDLRVLRLSSNADGSENAVEIGRYLIEKGSVQTLDASEVAIDVEWTAVVLGQAPAEAVQNWPCYECCVVCDGQRVCACWVVTPCGGCCCRESCSCSAAAGTRPVNPTSSCSTVPPGR
jgi:hypothetical protein